MHYECIHNISRASQDGSQDGSGPPPPSPPPYRYRASGRHSPAPAGRAHPRRPGEPGERVGGARVGAEVGGPVGEGVEGILGLRRRPELRAGGEADARRGCARSCGYAAGDEIPEMRARPPGAGPLCRGIRVFRRAGACGARGCRAGRVVWRERLRGPLGDVLFGARCSIRAKR